MPENFGLLITLIVAAFALVYFVLPALKLRYRNQKLVLGILFGCMAVYLAYDFVQKGKYTYIIFLVMGSAAVIYMIINAKDAER
jgi:multisubunit Na+/H+ antiporter MnhE subunit